MVRGQAGSAPGAGSITHMREDCADAHMRKDCANAHMREDRARDAYAYHKSEAHAAALSLREMADRSLSNLSAATLRMAERIAAGMAIEQVALAEYLDTWTRALDRTPGAAGPAPHCLGL